MLYCQGLAGSNYQHFTVRKVLQPLGSNQYSYNGLSQSRGSHDPGVTLSENIGSQNLLVMPGFNLLGVDEMVLYPFTHDYDYQADFL